MLIALLVALIPTTIGALLSAIGIAGMDRLVRRNVLAMSGRAVEAAGDVDTLLLDKTGTITLGNRQATEFIPARGRRASTTWPRRRSSRRLADETPEGRSIVVLAKEQYGIREHELLELRGRVRPLHRPDPHERRRLDGTPHPQGRGRRDPGSSSTANGGRVPAEARATRCERIASQRRHPAAWWPATTACWA